MSFTPQSRLDDASLSNSSGLEDARRAMNEERHGMQTSRSMQRQFRRAVRKGDLKSIGVLGGTMKDMGISELGGGGIQGALQNNKIATDRANNRADLQSQIRSGEMLPNGNRNPAFKGQVNPSNQQQADQVGQAAEVHRVANGNPGIAPPTVDENGFVSAPASPATDPAGQSSTGSTQAPSARDEGGQNGRPAVVGWRDQRKQALDALTGKFTKQNEADSLAPKAAPQGIDPKYQAADDDRPAPTKAQVVAPELTRIKQKYAGQGFEEGDVEKAGALRDSQLAGETTGPADLSEAKRHLEDATKADEFSRSLPDRFADIDKKTGEKIENYKAGAQVQRDQRESYFSDLDKTIKYNSMGFFGNRNPKQFREEPKQPADIDLDLFDASKPNMGQNVPLYQSVYKDVELPSDNLTASGGRYVKSEFTGKMRPYWGGEREKPIEEKISDGKIDNENLRQDSNRLREEIEILTKAKSRADNTAALLARPL